MGYLSITHLANHLPPDFPTMRVPSPDHTSAELIAGLWRSGSSPASEDDCLDIIDALFPQSSCHVPLGRGDDCAELAMASNLVLSTDSFMEDVHFRTGYFTPFEVGAKALTGAISDLAAAGAVPLGFSLGLVLPGNTGTDILQSLMEGMASVARQNAIFLAGGDISRGKGYGFCVTVWGESADPAKGFFLRRGQASPEDVIFVIGDLGLARTGFELLEAQGRPALAKFPTPCLAHLSPKALTIEGVTLARLALLRPHLALGLMDVSDGLMQDLPRLLRKGAGKRPRAPGVNMPLGAILDFPQEYIPAEVRQYAEDHGLDAMDIFLAGGEEYSLLGTCAPSLWPQVQAELPKARSLGRVTAAPGITIGDRPVHYRGFDHFSKNTAPLEIRDRPLPPGLEEAGESILQCAAKAWQRGLLAGFNGNLSCRVPLAGLPCHEVDAWGCLITGTSVAKNSLTLHDLCLLRPDDQSVVAGCAPSSESTLHISIYSQHPAPAHCAAIVHVHPPKLLALSLRLAGSPFADWLALPLVESRLYKNLLAFVPEYPAGSPELARAVARAASTHRAVWMHNHGLVVYGPSLSRALALAEELEQIAAVRLDS